MHYACVTVDETVELMDGLEREFMVFVERRAILAVVVRR
jgi:hypothetical protein